MVHRQWTVDCCLKDIYSTSVYIISFFIKRMKCTIKAFGISKEIVGGKFLELEVPTGYTVFDLKKELFEKYPAFGDLRSLYIALNNEYADEAQVLKEGDEIALIPPVAGG